MVKGRWLTMTTKDPRQGKIRIPTHSNEKIFVPTSGQLHSDKRQRKSVGCSGLTFYSALAFFFVCVCAYADKGTVQIKDDSLCRLRYPVRAEGLGRLATWCRTGGHVKLAVKRLYSNALP